MDKNSYLSIKIEYYEKGEITEIEINKANFL